MGELNDHHSEDVRLPQLPRWHGVDDASSTPPAPTQEVAPDVGSAEDGPTSPEERPLRETDDAAPDEAPGAVLRQVGGALLGRDLIGPRPGLVPVGAKARARKQRHQQIEAEAQRRRTALRQEFDCALATTPLPTRWRPVERARNVTVIASLGVVVLAVVAALWWTGTRNAPEHSTPTVLVPRSSTVSTTGSPLTLHTPSPSSPPASSSLPPVAPIPAGGVTAITPTAPAPIAADTVDLDPVPTSAPEAGELSTPENAAVAWLRRWCTFTWTDPLGTAERRAQPAMTAAAWTLFDPARSERALASWQRTVAAQESGQCSAPRAIVSPEAPQSPRSAIVLVTADRVVTGATGAPYVEQVRETRIVLREDDTLWRVDTTTEGG